MNLLHVRSSDLFGSPERLILSQCRQLSDISSHCASFVRSGQISRFLQACTDAGVLAHEITEACAGDLRVIGRIRDILRSNRIEVVVTHDYKSTLLTYLARRSLPVRQIGYYHGRTAEDFKVRIYNAIDSFFLRRLDSVVAVSEMTKRQLATRGIDPSRIHVVPNAVDRDTISPPRPPRRADGPLRLVAAGRFSYEKGYDLLIDALAGTVSELPPLELHFYGTGPEEAELRARVLRHQLEKSVTFHGFVPDIRAVFREMDALVISSRSEGMPLVILEAWAESLGVVATAVGGIPEMITHGESGYLIPSVDLRSIQDALRQIASNPSALHTFGVRGRERLLARYTSEKQAELLRPIYLA